MQGWGCLEGQVGTVPEARGVPAPSSQGQSGDTEEPLCSLWGPDVPHPTGDSVCHHMVLERSQPELHWEQDGGWPDW